MHRVLPTLVFATLFLGGTALAQSFDPPSIPDISVPGFDIPQIDPPSLQIDVGPSDDDIGEAQEAIAGGISEALVTAAAGIAEALNPDGVAETDPGVAILEVLAGVEDEVRKGMTKADLVEALIEESVDAARRPKVREIVVVGSKVEEEVRRGLQQGRLILDSDFGP